MKNPLRQLYNWVLSWSEKPHGSWALFGLAFAESSFFPIPPDVLLIALTIALPAKAFRYALISSIGSLLGGCLGYLIGWQLYCLIGKSIINFYQLQEEFQRVGQLYGENAFLVVLIAGFTPIPYKVFTIAAGFWHDEVNFWTFILASVLSRSTRFFIVGGILYFIGPRAKIFIDRYFNIITLIFGILLVLGFLVLKWFKVKL